MIEIKEETLNEMVKTNMEYFNRIVNALEYIENSYDAEENVLMYTFDRDNIKELYKILKGE